MFFVEKDRLKGLVSGRNKLPRTQDTDGILIFGDGQTRAYWLYCPCKGQSMLVGTPSLTTPGTKWLPMKGVKAKLRQKYPSVFIDPADLPEASPDQTFSFSVWTKIFKLEDPETYSKYLGRGPWDTNEDQFFGFGEHILSDVSSGEGEDSFPPELEGVLCVHDALTGTTTFLFPATNKATWGECSCKESFAIWFPAEKLKAAERKDGVLCLHKADGSKPTAEQVEAVAMLSMFALGGPGIFKEAPFEGEKAAEDCDAPQ